METGEEMDTGREMEMVRDRDRCDKAKRKNFKDRNKQQAGFKQKVEILETMDPKQPSSTKLESLYTSDQDPL